TTPRRDSHNQARANLVSLTIPAGLRVPKVATGRLHRRNSDMLEELLNFETSISLDRSTYLTDSTNRRTRCHLQLERPRCRVHALPRRMPLVHLRLHRGMILLARDPTTPKANIQELEQLQAAPRDQCICSPSFGRSLPSCRQESLLEIRDLLPRVRS